MGRLIFVNRFYWPEEPATAQLLTDLAEAMAARGREVLVITSQPRRAPRAASEVRAGVVVHRVHGTKLGNRSVLRQACDFATFALAALFRLARTVRRGDTLVILTDPPLLGMPATLLAKARGARVVHWLQDIYPEAAVLLTGRKWLGLLRGPRNLAWRAADACVTLGEDMAALPRAAGVAAERLHLIPNWAPAGVEPVDPAEASRLRAEWGLTAKFVVLYFGNLGRVHDLHPVVSVAEGLRANADIEFVFVGPGAQREPLEAEVRARGLQNVRFYPAQPRERRTEVLALGDVHLVTLHVGGERVVFPSKLYGVCAAGKPVLFIGPTGSEIARQIHARGLGVAFERSATAAMSNYIREAARNPAALRRQAEAGRTFYATEASIAQAEARWAQVLAKVEIDARASS